MTGITISTRQVEIATRLSKAAAASFSSQGGDDILEGGAHDGFIALGDRGGKVRFIELDAEKMGEYFSSSSSSSSSSPQESGAAEEQGGFDVVWISEALSHFPNKALFFRNAHQLLRPGGKLVLADWFKAEGLSEKEFDADVKPIEGLFSPKLSRILVGDKADLRYRWHAPPAAVHAARVCRLGHRSGA